MLRKGLDVFLIVAATLYALTAPSHAQFGGIFGTNPPRPPGAVPNSPEPIYEDEEQVPDLPPQGRVLPTPNRAPANVAPRPGAVQNQPLGPPPGVTNIPQNMPGAPIQTAPGVVNAPTQPALPGLPPGQRQPTRGAAPAPATLQPGDEVVTAPPPAKIANKQAAFSGLDKITGRIIAFEADIGETVQFGALRVTPRVCYTRPATEAANTDAFVEVDEITLKGEVKRIFGGWIFAASPGLHAIEHPIYDVWLTDCKGAEQAVANTQPVSANPQPPQRAPAPQAQPKRQPAPQQAQQPGQPRPQVQPQRPVQQAPPPGPGPSFPPPVFAR